MLNLDIISGNLTAAISDHLSQFAMIHNVFGNITGNKSNFCERDQFKSDRQNFTVDCFSVDWAYLLKIEELNADNSIKIYLDKMNLLLDAYAPQNKLINTN